MLIRIAIELLWLLLGIIVIFGVIFGFWYVVRFFKMNPPDMLEKGSYIIAAILCCIVALSIIGGGGSIAPHIFR